MNKKENGYRQMFGGLASSKGAQNVVDQALRLGLDPTGITLRAANAAQQEGRNKVGLFGQAGKHIDGLRQVVDNARWQESLNKSRPR